MSSPLPLRIAGTLAHRWGDLRYHAKIALRLTSPPIVLPYRGWAGADAVHLTGRVVEDEKVIHARPTRSRWRNLWRTYRRYETDEIRGAEIAWSGFGLSGRTTTSREGFFSLTIERAELPDGLGDAHWQTIALRLDGAPGYRFTPIRCEAAIRCVSPDAAFAVVSDIDDTIVETSAQHFLDHVRTVALNSAESRVAFPGIAFLYRALAAGVRGGETNPIFYVSSSPWNLYELFAEFLERRGLPAGPMFLKDFGLTPTQWLTGSHAAHKTAAIETLLRGYPALAFILIGDTGQRDAEIYADIVRRHPGRILSVHLRDVSPKGQRPAVASAVAAIEAAGVPVTTSSTLEGAARTCEEHGLVAPGTGHAMRREIESDRARLAGGAAGVTSED